ncbi:UNVERIFIED_CONTAM: hypothetical protein K2H54_023831 [Gekko kuhli]
MDGIEYQNAEEVRTIIKYWFYSRILCCVGLLFLFVTLITPNWIRVKSALSNFSLGLWSICIDNSCRIVSGYSPILDVCRVLLSMSTICGLVAVSAALISNPRLGQSKWPLITNLTTALMSLVALLLFFLSVFDKVSFLEEEEDFRYAFSFSFVGGCVGCILFFITGFLFILIKIKESAIISPMRQEQMEQTPSTKKEIDESDDSSDPGIACAYGVM